MYTLEALDRLVAKNGITKLIPYLLSEDFPQCVKKLLEDEPGGFHGYLKKQFEKEGICNGDFVPI